MLVVCSNTHVLVSPLISVVVTRMQDLVFENFPAVIPSDSHSGRGDPLPTNPQLGLWPGAGASAPVLRPKLRSSQLSAVFCAPAR